MLKPSVVLSSSTGRLAFAAGVFTASTLLFGAWMVLNTRPHVTVIWHPAPPPPTISLACPGLPPTAVAATPLPATPSPPPPPTVCASAAHGVLRAGKDSFVVRRAVVDCLLARGPGSDARLVPDLTDGRPAGLKLYAVRAGGLVAALGLQNGDELLRLNGVDVMTTADHLRPFDTTRPLRLDLQRDGRPLTLRYRVQPPLSARR